MKRLARGVVVCGSEEEVGPVVVGDDGVPLSLKPAAVVEGAVEGVVVVDGHPDVFVLVAELEGVLAFDPGEVDLGSMRAGFCHWGGWCSDGRSR